MPRIVILSGAGLSAESGLGTFRDKGGLWENVALEEVATPEAFARDPAKVNAFYNARRRGCLAAEPNEAHHALTRLAAAMGDDLLHVTQNIDDLMERAGATGVIHMHGQITRAYCAACGHRWDAPAEITGDTPCPSCGATAARPDVVWFGEMPYALDEIEAALMGCETFVAIGTSGSVYPAAGFVQAALAVGARTVELTLEPSEVTHVFDDARHGKATETVTAWVDEALAARL